MYYYYQKNRLDNLIKHRVERGLTQQDMADYLGMGRSTYQRKEYGENQFLLNESIILMLFFGEPFMDLFGDLFESFARMEVDKNS
ncbi:DNA-binding transcriptional regulator, XRE-family HTH domain [Halarsenatibacter silvermanii]|uniref:DNA-binding transcriptional regulator, XRE-family HTH domain n=2 Tax=Halarsenatibacter silvermanii TaxID=321763 RepID=A0A1G9SN93_9FIRM|nr:DNA-binding transcriptional regulator, XRE-family HTH domain [Halarsenatibacter silvermanii]